MNELLGLIALTMVIIVSVGVVSYFFILYDQSQEEYMNQIKETALSSPLRADSWSNGTIAYFVNNGTEKTVTGLVYVLGGKFFTLSFSDMKVPTFLQGYMKYLPSCYSRVDFNGFVLGTTGTQVNNGITLDTGQRLAVPYPGGFVGLVTTGSAEWYPYYPTQGFYNMANQDSNVSEALLKQVYGENSVASNLLSQDEANLTIEVSGGGEVGVVASNGQWQEFTQGDWTMTLPKYVNVTLIAITGYDTTMDGFKVSGSFQGISSSYLFEEINLTGDAVVQAQFSYYSSSEFMNSSSTCPMKVYVNFNDAGYPFPGGYAVASGDGQSVVFDNTQYFVINYTQSLNVTFHNFPFSGYVDNKQTLSSGDQEVNPKFPFLAYELSFVNIQTGQSIYALSLLNTTFFGVGVQCYFLIYGNYYPGSLPEHVTLTYPGYRLSSSNSSSLLFLGIPSQIGENGSACCPAQCQTYSYPVLNETASMNGVFVAPGFSVNESVINVTVGEHNLTTDTEEGFQDLKIYMRPIVDVFIIPNGSGLLIANFTNAVTGDPQYQIINPLSFYEATVPWGSTVNVSADSFVNGVTFQGWRMNESGSLVLSNLMERPYSGLISVNVCLTTGDWVVICGSFSRYDVVNVSVVNGVGGILQGVSPPSDQVVYLSQNIPVSVNSIMCVEAFPYSSYLFSNWSGNVSYVTFHNYTLLEPNGKEGSYLSGTNVLFNPTMDVLVTKPFSLTSNYAPVPKDSYLSLGFDVNGSVQGNYTVFQDGNYTTYNMSNYNLIRLHVGAGHYPLNVYDVNFSFVVYNWQGGNQLGVSLSSENSSYVPIPHTHFLHLLHNSSTISNTEYSFPGNVINATVRANVAVTPVVIWVNGKPHLYGIYQTTMEGLTFYNKPTPWYDWLLYAVGLTIGIVVLIASAGGPSEIIEGVETTISQAIDEGVSLTTVKFFFRGLLKVAGLDFFDLTEGPSNTLLRIKTVLLVAYDADTYIALILSKEGITNNANIKTFVMAWYGFGTEATYPSFSRNDSNSVATYSSVPSSDVSIVNLNYAGSLETPPTQNEELLSLYESDSSSSNYLYKGTMYQVTNPVNYVNYGNTSLTDFSGTFNGVYLTWDQLSYLEIVKSSGGSLAGGLVSSFLGGFGLLTGVGTLLSLIQGSTRYAFFTYYSEPFLNQGNEAIRPSSWSYNVDLY
ncbi:hypothetical protein [Sulfuracidifex tepidarius]|uniref:Uncharacterized protein n=1 Tax=Sulfuracidifex tepidarius TaxID=1294262 RepID=A0A510E051_9CREN|nr:hypothetical protein [Sulfuracidifex tepidarius]BBG25873.1 hypothetical protein IC007_0378 [Sulfuracidifex tepidarius]